MNTKNYTIGLDLGDRRSTYCISDAAGKTVAEDAVATTRECFNALSARYAGAVIAMETGTHSPLVSRLFEAGRHKVYVANAREVRAISQSNTKSDQEDARMLNTGHIQVFLKPTRTARDGSIRRPSVAPSTWLLITRQS